MKEKLCKVQCSADTFSLPSRRKGVFKKSTAHRKGTSLRVFTSDIHGGRISPWRFFTKKTRGQRWFKWKLSWRFLPRAFWRVGAGGGKGLNFFKKATHPPPSFYIYCDSQRYHWWCRVSRGDYIFHCQHCEELPCCYSWWTGISWTSIMHYGSASCFHFFWWTFSGRVRMTDLCSGTTNVGGSHQAVAEQLM